jgi:hypothetical protein
MSSRQSTDEKERLDAMLRGAFAGAPTRLKDIPKKTGESRALRKNPRHPAKLKRGVNKTHKNG